MKYPKMNPIPAHSEDEIFMYQFNAYEPDYSEVVTESIVLPSVVADIDEYPDSTPYSYAEYDFLPQKRVAKTAILIQKRKVVSAWAI